MAYSSLLNTEILMSAYHSNYRTEFRLDADKVYSSNMRLSNVGMVRINGANGPYASCGVLGLIENIYLYDGNQELSKRQRVYEMAGLSNVLHSNDDNISGKKVSNHSNLGFFYNDKTNTIDGDGFVGDEITNDENTTAKGLLYLKDVFGLCKSTPVVDTRLWKDLRIVIEWRSQAKLREAVQGTSAITSGTILRPEMILDRLLDEGKYKVDSLKYYEYEFERLIVSPAGSGVQVQDKIKSNAFNNKFVNKLLIQNYEPAIAELSDANNVCKTSQSTPQLNEEVNFTINGKRFLDYKGLNNPAMKCRYFTDCFGEMNAPVNSDRYMINNRDGLKKANNIALRIESTQSYTGIELNQQINEMEVSYQRTGKVGNQPSMELHLFGRVLKEINIKGNSYLVGYA